MLLRLMLAVATTAFLATTLVLGLRNTRSGTADPLVRSWLALLMLVLLAALSVTLAFTPPAASTVFPVGQVILLVAAAALFCTALSMHRRHARQTVKLADDATLDGLTRLASHRVFQDRLVHECERAYRFGDTFVVAMLDLDNFRAVNDRHSHRVGDQILLDLARRLTAQLREIDLVARFGGDQFTMILPHTFEKGAIEVAERIRLSVAGWVFHSAEGSEIRLTVSLGLCSYPTDGASPRELVEVAQKALAFAKEMGGNQLQLYRDIPARGAPDNVVSLPHTGREAIVRSLAAAVDIRDGYTHAHEHLVSELSAAVARRLDLSAAEVARIKVGALLHDVGKIGVPDAILSKEGSLSPEEWECIRQHPMLGKKILEQAPELTDVVPLVLHHQERYDGTGYPGNLRGEEITLGARIIAVADAYHAIISDRPYRSRRTNHEATRELMRCSGGQFDPKVVQTLLEVLQSDGGLRALLPFDDDMAPLALDSDLPFPAVLAKRPA
jgi:diguanylate cyclase (GGDEF)-like protein